MACRIVLALACGTAVMACASGCGSGKGSSNAGSAEPPQAILSDTVLYYGSVQAGLTVEKSIAVRNAGGRELRVEVAPLTCDCLAVRPMELQVAPGETGRLRVAFSVSGAAGNEMKFVRLTTNGVRKRFDVWVLAHVESDVQFELHQ